MRAEPPVDPPRPPPAAAAEARRPAEAAPEPERISFRCIEVRQPIGTFYIGAMEAHELVRIAWADIRRLEDRALDEYLGIQRPLNEARVQELVEYVRTVDATFPTSIIVAVESKDTRFDELKAVMSLPKVDSVAKIIDGQHRIAGLKTLPPNTKFMVNVTIFVDMDIADQANVFATINLAQTKVSRSLVFDLYAYSKAPSPQKTCHDIARLMNRQPGGPFEGRIKRLGRATPGMESETLTQAAFVGRLLLYVTDNALRDRDLLKRGEDIPPTPLDRVRDLIFREMFRTKKDQDIALVLWNFFSAVRSRWPDGWQRVERGNILNRTTGFAALMRFLRPAYNAFGKPGVVPPIPHFGGLLERVRLRDTDFNPDRYAPGGTGEALLSKELVEGAGL
jgi:DGQHR domain-containing protein